MTSLIQRFLTAEAALFGGAALMHAGFLIRGHEHWKAATAESVIAFVLLAGLVATFVAPGSGRAFGLGAQGFALLGTLVGLFTIAIGVGPRTALDLLIHAVMIAVLAFGIRAVARGVATA